MGLLEANVRGFFRHPARRVVAQAATAVAAGWRQGPVELNRCPRALAPYGACIPGRGRKAMNTTGWQRLEGLGRWPCCPGRVGPHTLCHTFATDLLQAGYDIR